MATNLTVESTGDMSFWYQLPNNFEEVKDSCSVLVLLDGGEYFGIAKNTEALYRFAGIMPPTIVVAIPSTTESRWKYYTPTHQDYDSTRFAVDTKPLFKNSGHFMEFSEFVENNIINFLERKFQSHFISKSIFGHSLGGLAVISFYKYKPMLFDNYICASPSLIWDNYTLLRSYEKDVHHDEIDSRKMYLTVATPDMPHYVESTIDLYKSLRRNIKNSKSIISFKRYSNEGHATSGIKSLIDGLRYVYHDIVND